MAVTVAEFLEMDERGAFGPEARVELIDGAIVPLDPLGDRHPGRVIRASDLLFRRFGDGVIVWRGPLRLGDASRPYADLALLPYRADFYARHAIPEYWVEDIPGDRLVVHRDPSPEGYRSVRSLGRGERLTPLAFPTVELRVEELLG